MIDYDNMLFNIDIASGMPHPGAILVSEPFLREEYFAHAVICLVDYGLEESSMGVVMNRSTAYTLQGLVQGVSRREDVPVFCGGPMSCDRLYYLHTLGQFIPDSRQVVPGLYIGGDFNAMLDYVNSGLDIDGHIRFFIGYNRVWAVAEPSDPKELLTGADDPYWHRHVRMLGNRFRGWRYHPQNPHAN